MTHHAHPFRIRSGILLLILLVLLGLMPLAQPASAASEGWNEHIELDGKFEGGQFTLDSNTSQLFCVDAAVPGESWSGTITVSNHTGREMEVALLTITSQLDDLDLYRALTLDLSIGGEEIYSGSYGETPDPITQYYIIPNGASLELEATVSLPAHVGNEMMGKAMDSIWTFEAHVPQYITSLYPYTVRYLDASTGDELAPSKTGYAQKKFQLTETALSIDGYTPDAQEKSLIIQAQKNELVFLYTKVSSGDVPMPALIDDEPDTPDQPEPSETPGVDTGHDLTESNTITAIYLILAILCALAATIIYLQVRTSKKRRNIR